MAAYPELGFSAQSVEYENLSLQEVQAQLGVEGGFRLDAARIAMDGIGREISDFSLQGLIEEASIEGDEVLFRSSVRAGEFEAKSSS